MSFNLVGQTLGGYKLVELAGSGSVAAVYKAYQPTLERWVAIKVLQYKDSRAVVRFEREAKAIALLRHQNILIVYEYGTDRGWPYIVMEYVAGGSLADRITDQPMAWNYAVNLIIHIASALQYAHGRGIVHRDVKPSNILLPQHNWPLLADFGLVKLPKSPDTEEVTRGETTLGTPAYISPEQARAVAVDPRTDIYALGVILFQLVAGRLPFDYANTNKMLMAHISQPPPSPVAFNPNCPPALEEVIFKAMAKAPHQRFQDAGQLIAALQTLVDNSERGTTPLPPLADDRLQTLELEPPAAPDNDNPVLRPPEARILLTDRNVTLAIPHRETVIVGRTHRDKIADVDLGPHGAAQTGVSRHHARLTWQGDQWLIDDLGSLNGTFVNNVRLIPGSPILLNNGDVIKCSHTSFVFLI